MTGSITPTENARRLALAVVYVLDQIDHLAAMVKDNIETLVILIPRQHFIINGELALPSDPRLKVLPVVDAEMKINRYLACLKERRDEHLGEAFFSVASPSQAVTKGK